MRTLLSSLQTLGKGGSIVTSEDIEAQRAQRTSLWLQPSLINSSNEILTYIWCCTQPAPVFFNLITIKATPLISFLISDGEEGVFSEVPSNEVVVRLGGFRLPESFCVTHLPSLDGERQRGLGERKMGWVTRECLAGGFWWTVRVNISCFWLLFQFTPSVMKCFALVKMFPYPDFYLFTYLYITCPNPRRIWGCLPLK